MTLQRETLKPRYWMFSPSCYFIELVAIATAAGALLTTVLL